MSTIYIDDDYRCYLEAAEGRTAIGTNAFDGCAPEVIEGYRFVPAGAHWTREDGTVFAGEMVAPWRDSLELDAVQHAYERARMEEYTAALAELGVVIE